MHWSVAMTEPKAEWGEPDLELRDGDWTIEAAKVNTAVVDFRVKRCWFGEFPEDEPVVTGRLKWDGCVDMQLVGRSLHWCGPEDMRVFMCLVYQAGEQLLAKACDWTEGALRNERRRRDDV